MKTILILLFTIFLVNTVWAQNVKDLKLVNKKVSKVENLKKVEKTKVDSVKLKEPTKVIVDKTVNKEDTSKTKTAVVAVKKADGEKTTETVNTEGKDDSTAASLTEVKEEPKYESKSFLVNKTSKKANHLGNYYIQNSKLTLPKDFKVKDVPNDSGGVIEISWKGYTNDSPEGFDILRKSEKESSFKKIGTIDVRTIPYKYQDTYTNRRLNYIYKVEAHGKKFEAENSRDDNRLMQVSWTYEVQKLPKEFKVFRKEVLEKNKPSEFKEVAIVKSEKLVPYTFRDKVDNEVKFSYKIRVKKDGLYNETEVLTGTATDAIFDMKKLVSFLAALFLTIAIVIFIRMARSGKELYVRRLAGLDAVDDAVGRATEMGREIMFIPGISDINDPQTIAGLTILGRVAKLTAQYKTPLSVPVSKSMVMVTGREIVKESYLSAGRPENFQDGMVHYLTDDQFGFAAGVDGIMVREKPATIFLQGSFFAESLILAETGHHIGAIQISGTAVPSQLPFFITACDYTLMGEELYAASAYLSREPQLLGSLRGQDAGKALILVAIILGIVLETIASVKPEWAFLSIKEYFKLK